MVPEVNTTEECDPDDESDEEVLEANMMNEITE